MELPSRPAGDRLLRAGEMTDIRRRLRRVVPRHDLTAVVVCAYDHRMRMLPFLYADAWMAPAGPRAVGAALVDSGLARTRVVLQQWNRRARPSAMRLDGRPPDLLLISSLEVHADAAQAMLRDAWRIAPDRRPLILAGGPLCIYQPWAVFGPDPDDPWGADVAVTGEEYVLLGLLEALLALRAGREPLRRTLARAREAGALDGVPGLVYPTGGVDGAPGALVDTGIQRLLGDLDELPATALGYRILEPPARGAGLASRPLPAGRVRRHSPVASLVLMYGCRFGCDYCPIPAYNQRAHRVGSGARAAEEIARLHGEFGFRHFSCVASNFFERPERAAEVLSALADVEVGGRRLRDRVGWGTEATVHDALRCAHLLTSAREAGMTALWLGVEDMTATLVRKGQSVERTLRLFRLLAGAGIAPVPMLMHHDAQPLLTVGRAYGLLNQVHLLRRAGAIDLQVLMTTPAPGSRVYERAYASGTAYARVGRTPVGPAVAGDAFVIASRSPRPWRKQLNMLAAYAFFFNPLRLIGSLLRPSGRSRAAAAACQAKGMWGLVRTARRGLGWAWRLWRGPIRRAARPPVSPIAMRDPTGAAAAHALPGTPRPRPASGPDRPRRRTPAHYAASRRLGTTAPARRR